MIGAGDEEGEDGGVAGAPGRDDNVEEQGAGERERERNFQIERVHVFMAHYNHRVHVLG
jgi:hypothetical protein